MVNVPYRPSDSIVADVVAARLDAVRRTAGAVLLAIFAAVVAGTLLKALPADAGGGALRDLLPTEDPAIWASFSA